MGFVDEEYDLVVYTWRGGSRRLITAWKVGEDGRQYSLDEIVLMNEGSDVSPTGADAPTIEPDDDFWRDAKVMMPRGTTAVHLRIDAETLDWFRVQDDEPLARMSAVLRSYAQAQRRRPQR